MEMVVRDQTTPMTSSTRGAQRYPRRLAYPFNAVEPRTTNPETVKLQTWIPTARQRERTRQTATSRLAPNCMYATSHRMSKAGRPI